MRTLRGMVEVAPYTWKIQVGMEWEIKFNESKNRYELHELFPGSDRPKLLAYCDGDWIWTTRGVKISPLQMKTLLHMAMD